MDVSISSLYYTIISSSNTSTTSYVRIYPVFNIGVDSDGNGVFDGWEMQLAKKFCPSLYLHSGDNGVRPVPVESMDRNGDGELGWEDLLVTCFNLGATNLGEYTPDELYLNNLDGTGSGFFLYEIYPTLVPVHKVFGLIDFNHNGVFDDGDEHLFYALPHFEWGSIGQTNSSS
jgi:hypothetical protein